MSCPSCRNTGWRCEEHPTEPMHHDGCSGAGMSCTSWAGTPAATRGGPRKGLRGETQEECVVVTLLAAGALIGIRRGSLAGVVLLALLATVWWHEGIEPWQ